MSGLALGEIQSSPLPSLMVPESEGDDVNIHVNATSAFANDQKQQDEQSDDGSRTCTRHLGRTASTASKLSFSSAVAAIVPDADDGTASREAQQVIHEPQSFPKTDGDQKLGQNDIFGTSALPTAQEMQRKVFERSLKRQVSDVLTEAALDPQGGARKLARHLSRQGSADTSASRSSIAVVAEDVTQAPSEALEVSDGVDGPDASYDVEEMAASMMSSSGVDGDDGSKWQSSWLRF